LPSIRKAACIDDQLQVSPHRYEEVGRHYSTPCSFPEIATGEALKKERLHLDSDIKFIYVQSVPAIYAFLKTIAEGVSY
jgi:hypothetical protein